MSGSDFLWFLEDIWLDLVNLDTADLPSLFFRLVLLLIGGTILLRVTVTVTRNIVIAYFAPALGSLLCGIWRVLTFPFWFPFRLVRNYVFRPLKARSTRKRYEREQAAYRERQRQETAAAAASERERLAALRDILKVE